MKFKLEGVIPAIVTPFTRGGARVDLDKACAFAETLVERGVQGIFVAGSTGEGLLMSVTERKALAEALVDAVGKKLKVVIQSGCLDTPGTIELTRHARDIGAAAVAVYAPGFYRYDDEALYGHFKRTAKSAPDMPLLLYNIPRYTGNNLSPELIARLANDVDSIVGMKDSSGDMIHLGRILAETPKNFIVINGVDEYTYQAYLIGAAGSVAITANVVPELFLAIRNHVRNGNLKKGLAEQRRLGEVIRALGYGQKVSTYKEALRLMGYDPGFCRPPQRELNAPEKRAVHRELKRLGIV